MNWDRIEGNWKQIKGNLIEQWDDLTEDQLPSRIEETYEGADDDAGNPDQLGRSAPRPGPTR